METKQPFKILSKICLNNWHYIDQKILTFSEGINFFTGHSGSGKSTVIDAMQIVLYANTDGRGFFNKAAADDSDRSLIEYLRGMVNINEHNEFQYLRNQNFSSTIVLELEQSDTKEKQCIGVVFDVDTATNDISRLFFWHMGGLLENNYRTTSRCLTTMEMREYLQRSFPAEQFYCGPSNERFRRQMYDIYLGGLDAEKFPRLFKRAIPFKMNIKLEDFVKEYICMEQDIHIEDLQESVMQYARMRSKIEETLNEIQKLQDIHGRYEAFQEKEKEVLLCTYQIDRLEMLKLEGQIQACIDKEKARKEGTGEQEAILSLLKKEEVELQKQYEEIILRIANSGYANLEAELAAVNETLEHLQTSQGKWQQISERLEAWKEQDVVSNQMLWDMEKFTKGTIMAEELERLQESFGEVREELLLVGTRLFGQHIVHVTQVIDLGIVRREFRPGTEHVADTLAYGIDVERRIHFEQVHAHVHTDDISYRIGVGLEFHAPARLPGAGSGQQRHGCQGKKCFTHIIYFRFFEKTKISRHPRTAAAIEPIRIAILPRSARSGSV